MANQNLYKASKQAIKNIFKKPATRKFPKKIVNPPSGFRGPPELDPSKCSLCMRCARVCPTGAISILEVGENKSSFEIDLGKCCYCGECVDACNFDAIKLTEEWLTAELERENLKRKKFVQKASKKARRDK